MFTQTRFRGIIDNKSARIILVIIVAAGLIYQAIQISALSSQLEEKSKTLEAQNQQIADSMSTIDAQQLEIEDKTLEIDYLTLQTDFLGSEIAIKEQEIAEKTQAIQSLSGAIDQQRSQMQLLQSQTLQLQNQVNQLKQEVNENQARISELTKQVESNKAQLDSAKRIKVSHYGLGVTEDNSGIVFPIEVEIIGSGDGTISVDVKNVQYEASFQDAVRTAAAVASDYSGISVSDKDIIIRFVNDDKGLIRVDGGSAGSLVTGMIIAGLTDREVDPGVLLTGTIKPDGTIGKIAGLQSKTDAAAEFGAEKILVPSEQKFWHESITIVGVSDIDDVMRFLAPN